MTKKAKPPKTAARCRVDAFFAEIRSLRRAMTPAERIEALEWVLDEAAMYVSDIVRQGAANQEGAAAMWMHVRYSAETITRLEERERLKASASGSGTICVVISGVDPTSIVTGDQ